MIRWVYDGARYFLGLIFLVFGANGLIMVLTGKGFLPMPPPSEAMVPVMTGFMATHYLLPLVKFLEVFCSLLFLSNRYMNLAVVLTGPIVVNILCIHIFAEPAGLPVATFVGVLWGILLLGRWPELRVILKA